MTGQFLNLPNVAKVLGGEIVRGAILCPGPGHSRRDRSLSVRFSSSAPGGFVVHSFAGDDPFTCKDHVRAVLDMPFATAAAIHVPSMPLPRPKVEHAASQHALKLWQEGADPKETPVAYYLKARGVCLPAGAAGAAIRYHGSCPFKGDRFPAMLALVRDIATNEPRAVHRTAITSGGKNVRGKEGKSLRLSLGPIAGGAVKLTEDADSLGCLGIGEGIETVLSLRALPEFGPSPVWALLNAGNLAAFPALSGIECLWIAEDNDDAGKRATKEAGRRWHEAGCEVFAVKAIDHKADLNDIAKAVHHA